MVNVQDIASKNTKYRETGMSRPHKTKKEGAKWNELF